MTARERVLAAYGGRCAYCGTAPPDVTLEIDHVQGGQGQGNAHRAAITTRLERWLCREFRRLGSYPVGYQLLCVRPDRTGCHDKKSGRSPHMPARKGNISVNLSLPADLAERLTVLAAQPGQTRSGVMETALRKLLEEGASTSLVEGLHQRLDRLAQAVESLAQHLKALGRPVETYRCTDQPFLLPLRGPQAPPPPLVGVWVLVKDTESRLLAGFPGRAAWGLFATQAACEARQAELTAGQRVTWYQKPLSWANVRATFRVGQLAGGQAVWCQAPAPPAPVRPLEARYRAGPGWTCPDCE
jgi:predicted DNA-binding protein